MSGKKKKTQAGGPACVTTAETRPSPPVITVDYEKYAHFLENEDLSEDQKREFIETLWRIIVSFVDLGFGVHPAQQAQKACGKLRQNRPETPSRTPDAVEWNSQFLINNFEYATGLDTEPEAEGV